jgi:cysteinyl-tRNA synthetase
MEQAKNSLARIRNAKSSLQHAIANSTLNFSDMEKAEINSMNVFREKFKKAMDDDLNTADGITAVFELVTKINNQLKDGASKDFAERALGLLQELCDVLGLLQDKERESIDEELDTLLKERQEARDRKDFKRSDEIRDILKEKGITLKDTPQGLQIIRD